MASQPRSSESSPSSPGESFPIRLRNRRIYILPTRQGLLFMAVLGVMLLGSLNEHNNLGLAMTFLLGGILFVSLFHTRRNLSNLEILSAGAAPVFAGDRAAFDLRLRSGKWPRRAVALALEREKAVLMDLPAERDAAVRLPFPTHRRGRLVPKSLRVSTRFPLGLFRAWSRAPFPAAGLVYPKPLPGPVTPASAATEGDRSRNDTGQKPGVEDFQGLRPYQPGDPPQHIAWKALSRGQGLFTKDFVAMAGSTRVLDWRRVREKDPERRLSVLCHHLLEAERNRIASILRIGSREIGPGLGAAHRHRCLKALALAEETA